jgi:hypothetical protein
MPPAMSRPWLVTFRSMTKSTIPKRIKITLIAGGMIIIRRVPSGRPIDIRKRVASSLESDCTVPYDDDFILVYGPRSSPHLVDGHTNRGPYNAVPKILRVAEICVLVAATSLASDAEEGRIGDGRNRHHATLDRVAHHQICRLRDASWHVRSAARSPGEVLFESSGPPS